MVKRPIHSEKGMHLLLKETSYITKRVYPAMAGRKEAE